MNESIGQTSGVTRRQALIVAGLGAASRASLAELGRGQGASTQSATPSAAGDLTISKPELTTAGLQAILNAAIAKAEELKVPSIVTVLDSSGVQQAFFRMENAPMIPRSSPQLLPSHGSPSSVVGCP